MIVVYLFNAPYFKISICRNSWVQKSFYVNLDNWKHYDPYFEKIWFSFAWFLFWLLSDFFEQHFDSILQKKNCIVTFNQILLIFLFVNISAITITLAFAKAFWLQMHFHWTSPKVCFTRFRNRSGWNFRFCRDSSPSAESRRGREEGSRLPLNYWKFLNKSDFDECASSNEKNSLK